MFVKIGVPDCHIKLVFKCTYDNLKMDWKKKEPRLKAIRSAFV